MSTPNEATAPADTWISGAVFSILHLLPRVSSRGWFPHSASAVTVHEMKVCWGVSVKGVPRQPS